MLIQWCCFLLLSHYLCLVKPLTCDSNMEYPFPKTNPERCCKKCPPGQIMKVRCTSQEETECMPCGEGYYSTEYSTEMQCNLCRWCDDENMKYKRNCTPQSNAVCVCENGYKCNDVNCEHCVKSPMTTTTPTTTTAATTVVPFKTTKVPFKTTKVPFKTTKVPPRPSQDSVWIVLSLCCTCVCILLTCFILISRHNCGRTTPASAVCCIWTLEKSPSETSQSTLDEEVPMPVQEVSGGKWQEEV